MHVHAHVVNLAAQHILCTLKPPNVVINRIKREEEAATYPARTRVRQPKPQRTNRIDVVSSLRQVELYARVFGSTVATQIGSWGSNIYHPPATITAATQQSPPQYVYATITTTTTTITAPIGERTRR